MAVCRFYLNNNCRFGDRCRDEHPGSARDNNRAQGSNTNRFAPLTGGDRYRPGQPSTFGGGRDQRTNTPNMYHLSKEDMKADLTDQRPIYPLSAYGPGRDAPRQLIEGPVEISPEELRLRYYTLRAAGNEAAAQQEERELASRMESQVQGILKDLDGAIKYVLDGADAPGNRLDIAKGTAKVGGTGSSNPFSQPPSNPLGGPSQPQNTAFGKPAAPAFGQTGLGAFGRPAAQSTPAFGQPANPGQASSPFGQPSALGGVGAFGKPSMPGAGAFGQPSGLGQTSAFGQPAALGAGSAFGKPSMPGSGSAFGQPGALGQTSAFGQPSAPGAGSAFGKPSLPGAGSAFGQTGTLGQTSAFGKPAFGQPAQPGAAASPFGQPQPSQQTPAFGQQQQQQQTQPSPFGQQQQPGNQPSIFGQQQQQQQQPTNNPSPFGQQRQQQQQQAPTFGQSGFGQPVASPFAQQQQPPAQSPSAFAQQSQPPTAPSAFGQQGPAGSPFQQQSQPTQAVGQPVAATPRPAGPIDEKDRFKEGKPEDYEGEKGRVLEQIYRRVGESGRFADDEPIPLVPPKCEWIVPVEMI